MSSRRTGIMLAYPFEEGRLIKWEPPYIIQPKLDGLRCRVLFTGDKSDDPPLLVSSEENPFFSVPHIVEALCKWNVGGSKLELDGELYCHGWSFERIFSVCSRSSINLHPEFDKISFYCFDIVTNVVQVGRLHMLDNMERVTFESPIVKVPWYLVDTLDELIEYKNLFVSQGYEGFIVRQKDAPYKRTRSTMMMKWKSKRKDSYRIVGTVQEISKDGYAKESLGALVLDGKNGETFNCGSGFTRYGELGRVELWRNRGDLLDRWATIEFQHLTHARGVPRNPIIMKISDRDESD